jgi:hypothetical protein
MMSLFSNIPTRVGIAVGTAVVILFTIGGVALADIPNSKTKVFSGCVAKKTGVLRVIDREAGKKCRKKERAITWSQAGPAGAVGATGGTGATGATGPAGASAIAAADQRFSIMWVGAASAPQSAAIRGDASIRSTTDAGLTVTRVGAGSYCIHVTTPTEGTVGVLQNQGDSMGTIDVTMGIAIPCSTVPTAQIGVRTWSIG